MKLAIVASVVLALSCSNEVVTVASPMIVPMTPAVQQRQAQPPPGSAYARKKGSGDISYMATLEQLRLNFDLQPWIEPINQAATSPSNAPGVVFPAGSASGALQSASLQLPYGVIAREFLAFGVDVQPGTGVAANRNHAKIGSWFPDDPRSEPSRIVDDLLQGTLAGGGLNQYRAGLYLRKGRERTFRFESLSAVAALHTLSFYAALRGYQLRAKGSLQAQQRTWEEWAELGYTAEPDPLEVELTPPAAPSLLESSEELKFSEDTLISGLTLAPIVGGSINAGGSLLDPFPTHINYLVYVEPIDGGASWMSSWASLPCLGWYEKESSVSWPIPFYVPKDSKWKFHIRKAYDDNATSQAVHFALDSYKLVKAQ